ncbi:DUF6240 domain-containing protein [Alkaliphilus transvaalensis]|uniref:DUF6240 domain-containing protein n=1 Tax=Alkaliphilus transvaalensis TaxID=114628 RepID=UPI000478D36C|nr:DUF6240 domain-containing protein [Alkaliphilus transvaalensis]
MDNGIRKPINILFNQVYGNGMTSLKRRGNNGVQNQEAPLNNLLQDKKVAILPEEEGKYNKLLKSFNMPVKEDLVQALKILDIHGLNLSKDNLTQYISAKNQLEELVKGLDYNTALELIKDDVDLENESLEEVVEKLEDAKKEEKSFSLRNLLKGFKSLSTDEAEEIAYKLFGNKQGKDITDIIKALHKAGMEISRKNINRVNDVFNKLHNIKDYSDEGLVEVVKNKIETNIDHLYKMKNSIKRGAIAIEEKLSHYASKIYDNFNASRSKPTEKDLRLLEEDIKGLLEREGVETTNESVALSKKLIKHDMEVSKENINKVYQLKENLEVLVKVLDKEKLALLIKAGYDVEKEGIANLVKLIQELDSVALEAQLPNESPLTEEAKINEILEKVIKLGEIKDEELLLLLNKGEDFKLKDLQHIKMTGGYMASSEIEGNLTYNGTVKMISLLNQIGSGDINTIGQHIRNNIPITIESLAYKDSTNKGQADTIVNKLASVMGTNNEVQQVFREMNFIRSNLTASMVASGIEKGLQLEKMELGKVTNFINDYQMTKGNWELIETLPQIQKQGENLLAILMKNNMPTNLKDLQQVSHFLKNEHQIGHQLQDIFDRLQREGKESLKNEVTEMKLKIKEMTDELKNGKVDLRKYNQEFSRIIKSLENMGSQLDSKAREELAKGLNKLSETIETQNQLNEKDTAIQMPIMMDHQIKNLQIYVMKEKQGSKKIDPKNMSVLLNMDTNSMGNINVYLGVNYKQLTLKVGVNYKENQELMEENLPTLKTMLSNLGYEIKEISFKVEEDLHLMSMIEEIAEKQKTVKHSIDMMI